MKKIELCIATTVSIGDQFCPALQFRTSEGGWHVAPVGDTSYQSELVAIEEAQRVLASFEAAAYDILNAEHEVCVEPGLVLS